MPITATHPQKIDSLLELVKRKFTAALLKQEKEGVDKLVAIDKVAAILINEMFSKEDIEKIASEKKAEYAQQQIEKQKTEKNVQAQNNDVQQKKGTLQSEQKQKAESLQQAKNSENRGVISWLWNNSWFGSENAADSTSSAAAEKTRELSITGHSDDVSDFENVGPLRNTVFEEHGHNLKGFFENLKARKNAKNAGLIITKKNLSEIIDEYKNSEFNAHDTFGMLKRIIYPQYKPLDKQSKNFKINENKIDEKELSEKIELLIQFFSSQQFDEILTLLNQRLEKEKSEEYTVHDDLSDSPLTLSPCGTVESLSSVAGLGNQNLVSFPTIPVSFVSAAPSARTSSIVSDLSISTESGSPILSGMMKVKKNWMERLLEIVIEQKLPCPTPDTLDDSLINRMKSDSMKSTSAIKQRS